MSPHFFHRLNNEQFFVKSFLLTFVARLGLGILVLRFSLIIWYISETQLFNIVFSVQTLNCSDLVESKFRHLKASFLNLLYTWRKVT